MNLTNQFPSIVNSLRYEAGHLFPTRLTISSEEPDLVSVHALAAAMEAIYHISSEDYPASALAKVEEGEGGIGIMCAAINYAWVFECIACDAIDWNKNAEVWPYWLQEHAGEILTLTGVGELDSEAFEDRVRAWLAEQPEIPILLPAEAPGAWVSLTGSNQLLPGQAEEVYVLTSAGVPLKGYRVRDDWFTVGDRMISGTITHWAPVVKKYNRGVQHT